MTDPAFQRHLAERAGESGLELSRSLAGRLETYYTLLRRWNRTINLAGMNLDTGAPAAIDRLLVEPVVAARACHPGTVRRMVDIGSGGGSPGIPLAMALGDPFLTLVESRIRKAAFLREALRTVELTGSVEVARWESLADRDDRIGGYDLLSVRAVRIQPQDWAELARFVRPGGTLFFFRGAAAPMDDLPATLEWQGSRPLVPSLNSTLAIVRRVDR